MTRAGLVSAAAGWGVCLAVAMALPGAASAQDATALVRTRHDSVRALLRRPAATEAAREARQRAVWEELATFVDYAEIARRSLVDDWDTLTEPQRAELTQLITTIIQRQYASSLEQVVDWEIAYEGESPRGDDRVVETMARSRAERRRPPVIIVYTLHRVGRGWRVCDLSTDGVSTVARNRSSFHRVLARDGWEGLRDLLRERVGSL